MAPQTRGIPCAHFLRTNWKGTALALLLPLLWPTPPGARAAEPPTTLIGQVLTPPGTPAAGLRILLAPLSPDPSAAARAATTDQEGGFVFDHIPSGRVALTVTSGEPSRRIEAAQVVDVAAGQRNEVTLTARPTAGGASQGEAATFNFRLYKGEYYNDQPSAATANLVMVTAGTTTSDINFDLATGGGTIAGRVVADGTGTPVPDMPVHALGLNSSISSFDRTDADGNYRITGIPADSFFVRVNGYPWSNHVNEYHGNVPGPAGATAVVVAEGQHVTGIDFSLAVGGRIAGRVRADAGGDPLGSVLVIATGTAPPFPTKSTGTFDGDFEIGGLPPGAYRVEFRSGDGYLAEYHHDRATADAADAVTVNAGEVTTVQAGLALGGRITGTVTNSANGGVLAGRRVSVTRFEDGAFGAESTTLADGTYAVIGLPTGAYRVSVPEIGQWYDSRGDSSSADAVNVTAGATTAQIDFSGTPVAGTCDPDPGSRISIGGNVTANGQPVSTFFTLVELFADSDTLPGESPTRAWRAAVRPDPGGHFKFDCLEAGVYYVRCVPGSTEYLSQWYAHADSAHAIGLPVSPGHSLDNVNLALQSGGRISGRVTANGSGIGTFSLRARNLATGELFGTFGGNPSGQYTLSSGPTGGMASGAYLVWTEDVTTANAFLLPVTLARFEAIPAAGGIAVEWRTAEEHDHVGFHVYRAESSTGAAARLTDRLITGGPEYRFLDETAAAERTYWYWLGAVDRQGREERLGPVTASSGTPAVSQLLGVFPNPLQAQSVVHFSVAAPVRARVQVFDVAGRLVRTLADRDYPAGRASVTWDGLGDNGVATRAGVYFVRFSAGAARGTAKLLVAR